MPIDDRPTRLTAALLLLLLLAASGCALAPKSQVEDARARVQSLQAENQRLREIALNVRGRNRVLVQRAIDDSRLLQAREGAIEEYETYLAAARAEREELLAIVDEIRAQARSAAADLPPRR